jgi:hypothetical protein
VWFASFHDPDNVQKTSRILNTKQKGPEENRLRPLNFGKLLI